MLKLKNKFQILLHINMSTFKQILNPITGRSEWEPKCENYDYHQEIARAAFADMLHDTERNQKYYKGLKVAIDKIHKRGEKAHVLDIGTGTGILSMMAVKCGADSVTACEAFRPMADCAEKIIEQNGMRGDIKIIKKRSTEIVIGLNGDMSKRANILVTEVFDTELIGEGAIGIFNHAHEHLLEVNCIVVPDSATMYAQVVESPFIWAWNMPKVLANLDGEILLQTPDEILKCKGSAALHDVQLNQFPIDKFKPVSDPIPVLNFDWSGRTKIPTENTSTTKLIAKRTSAPHAVFMWWDLKMDQENDIILSCAPAWAHPDFIELSKVNPNSVPPQNVIPWRDHWMQAIYFLSGELRVQESKEYFLNFWHDEYSLWFEASDVPGQKVNEIRQPLCECGFHNAYSRTRIGQLNDSLRNKKYLKWLEQEINDKSVVLSLGDGSLLGMSSSALGAQKVYCLEPHRYSHQVAQKYIKCNNLKNVQLLENLKDLPIAKEITHIIAEPSFISSILPFDNFYFGTLLNQIQENLSENVVILPKIAKIYALPVEFLDLHKIRSPLGICEEFDLSSFDHFIEASSTQADAIVEAQPLWEYPSIALAEPKEIISVDFTNFTLKKESTINWLFKKNGVCNGIALWVDWELGENKNIVTSGPSKPIEIGEYIDDWDIHSRQGVHLFAHAKPVLSGSTKLTCNCKFVPVDGELNFKFDLF